jgi:hypothetical protein
MILGDIRFFMACVALAGAATASQADVFGIGAFSGSETVIDFSSIGSGVVPSTAFHPLAARSTWHNVHRVKCADPH